MIYGGNNMAFHFNPETGRKGICKATKKVCPLVHGATAEEAQKNYENMMEKYSSIALSKKNSNKKYVIKEPISSVKRKTPLKELAAEDIADTIIIEAKDSGMNVEKVQEAINLATLLHEGQTRGPRVINGVFKDKVNYIEHPLRNTLRLMRLGVEDQNIIVASLLHDTVEDGSQNFAQQFLKKELEENEARQELSNHIRNSFNPEVENIVQAVTNEHIPLKRIQSMSMEERRKIYRDHVDENIKHNSGALMVKVSDFIDNATGLHHNDFEGKEKAILKRALKYLPVIEIFRKRIAENKLPVSEENKKVILGQLDRTEVRLNMLISKHGS